MPGILFISKEFYQCTMRNLLEPSDLPEPSDMSEESELSDMLLNFKKHCALCIKLSIMN